MQQSPFRNAILTILLMACLIAAGIPAVMAENGTDTSSSAGGTVIVMSFPEGASVFLNDEYRGITPIKIQNIPPGKYLVNISKEGSSNDSAPVILYEGSTREIGFTLESLSPTTPAPTGSGSVAVSSTPGGATVTLDGNVVGTTRMERASLILNDIPAGMHTISVELAGYPPYTETVTVRKNQVVKVSAEFSSETPAVTGTSGTPVIPSGTAGGKQPAPLSPLGAAAAAGLAGLVTVLRRNNGNP
jgi:hypothetical protein